MSWFDAPISEAQIIDGEPKARSWNLHNAREGGVSMNYWDCTAGRFTWTYFTDEMVQILEGEVHITWPDGTTTTLREGDTAHFEAGTTLHWDVPVYVRKLAFHRSLQTLPDRILAKLLRMTRGRPVVPALGATAAVGTAVAVAL